MISAAIVTLTTHGLMLRCAADGLREDRVLGDADAQLFIGWRADYQALVRTGRPAGPELLHLGERIYDWLNGPEQFLRRALESLVAPLTIEFTVARQDNGTVARAFLDVPWELLASEGRHWALAEDIVLCPVRRIGSALGPPAPSPDRLSLVFMAAAPRGADTLAYEAEEAAILRATQDITLDLVVEENGTLDLLAACVAREHPDVVQISCHGSLTPEPALVLEDELGDKALIKSSQLVRKLAVHQPRLLFLSACETAQADPVLDSLARTLVRAGVPGVLGWAASVLDVEATIFAAHLYARLTRGEALEQAVAYARLDLAQSEQLPRGGARDWHLARMYLSPHGGGALAQADGPRKQIGRGQTLKAFLDAKSKLVPVAGEREFVGRRREIQAILRAFRASPAERPAGVLIYGPGRQGKSSLAARIAQRLEPTHELVVLYGRYDAAAILSGVRERLGTSETSEICKRYLPEVERDPTQLLPALTELLEGPCQQRRKAGDKLIASPLLLVLDDFEQALEPHPDGLHRVMPELVESTRALLHAFNAAATDSRLLFTSRYRFTLPQGSVDLARRLQNVALHGMDSREARKQAVAKLRELPVQPQRLIALHERLEPIVKAARGNPGLQDLLFSVCLQRSDTCDVCLAAMETYCESGMSPDEEHVRRFLENLAIETLLSLLSARERDLLRASTLFELPVPDAAMRALSKEPSAQSALDRITALGLWEVFEDVHRRDATAYAINAMVRPKAGTLDASERQRLAERALPALFGCWGGENAQRTGIQDYELTRLGLLAGAAKPLAASAAGAVRHLQDRFEYRRAAHLAQEVIDCLAAVGLDESLPSLLTLKGAALMDAAEYADAETAFQGALDVNEMIHGSEDLSLVPRLQSLTTLYELHGKYELATQHAQRALNIHDRLSGQEDEDFAKSLYSFALIREAQGQYREGLSLVCRALEIQERILGKVDEEVAITLNLMAKLVAHIGQYEEAFSIYGKAIEIWSGIPGSTHREVAFLYNNIAMLYYHVGQYEAAESCLESALNIWERIYGVNGCHPELAETISNMGLVHLHNERPADAEPLFRRALDLWERAWGPNHPYIATGWNNLGLCCLLRQQYQDAGELFARAIAIWQENLGEESENIAIALNNLADVSFLRGEIDRAIDYGQRALAMHERALGPFHRDLFAPLLNLERYFLSKNLHEEAGQCRNRIEQINAKALDALLAPPVSDNSRVG